MEKEVGTASEMATANVGGGFNNAKEAVFNFLGNVFNWLSTHQGVALIIILAILVIIIYIIVRLKKTGKQLERKVSAKDTEIGKKDALIEDQKSKLEALQRKLADQQEVVSQALLRTLMTLTGYDIGQLQIFFKFLTEIEGNPLHPVDSQPNSMPASPGPEEKADDATAELDPREIIAPDAAPEKVVEPDKSGKE